MFFSSTVPGDGERYFGLMNAIEGMLTFKVGAGDVGSVFSIGIFTFMLVGDYVGCGDGWVFIFGEVGMDNCGEGGWKVLEWEDGEVLCINCLKCGYRLSITTFFFYIINAYYY